VPVTDEGPSWLGVALIVLGAGAGKQSADGRREGSAAAA
jgi:hypothetical protein